MLVRFIFTYYLFLLHGKKCVCQVHDVRFLKKGEKDGDVMLNAFKHFIKSIRKKTSAVNADATFNRSKFMRLWKLHQTGNRLLS